MLRILAYFLRAAISVAKLKRGLYAFPAAHPKIAPTSFPASYLVTDGVSIYSCDRENVLEDLKSSGQLTFTFEIELQQVSDDLLESATSQAAPADNAYN